MYLHETGFSAYTSTETTYNRLNEEADMRTELFSIIAGYEIDLQKRKTMPLAVVSFTRIRVPDSRQNLGQHSDQDYFLKARFKLQVIDDLL